MDELSPLQKDIHNAICTSELHGSEWCLLDGVMLTWIVGIEKVYLDHDLAKKNELLEAIGEDNPLEPTPDAVGKADPAKWREWSIVENNEKAKLRTVVERVYPEGGEK